MTLFFADTSAIIKRYITEVGSPWMMAQVQPQSGNLVIISALATVEVCSALARLQRLKQLSPAYAAQRRADFLIDVDQGYLTVAIDEPVLMHGRDLVSKYPLRTLDSVQLACALEAFAALGEPMTFLSADNDLLAAASGEGFAIDNPMAHP